MGVGLVAGGLVAGSVVAWPGCGQMVGPATAPSAQPCYHCQYGYAAPQRPVRPAGWSGYPAPGMAIYAPGYTYGSASSLGGGASWGYGSW